MHHIDTTFLERCILTLEKAYAGVNQAKTSDIEYDLYRSACVKEFEIILEQCGKLLRKVLKPYFHSDKSADQLVFKDIFRHCTQRQLMSADLCQRFLEYRDNRNHTAHDYGEHFAEETLKLLAQFIQDARTVVQIIQESQNAHS
jgi:hypothetical protein